MSSTAPPLRGVGVWATPGTASRPPSGVARGSPSGAELEVFKRAVRPSWWRSLSPILTTAVLGAAVVLVASEGPAPVTVRRMLTPAVVDRARMDPVAPSHDEYRLPEHWRTALGPPPSPCNPLSGIGC